MRTEVVNNLADEALYQLQYCKKINLTQKKFNKILLILLISIFICLIVILAYYYLKF